MVQKKICMLGAFAVGKTSLVTRFVDSSFSEKYHTTMGVRIEKKACSLVGRSGI
jgi:GTPase SAR1 family protein